MNEREDGDEDGEDEERVREGTSGPGGLILLVVAEAGRAGPAGQDLGALEELDLLERNEVHGATQPVRVSAFW